MSEDDDVIEWGAALDEKDDEIERLRVERAGDQQRLFHYEAEIERLGEVILEHEACERKQELEIERLRAAIAKAERK